MKKLFLFAIAAFAAILFNSCIREVRREDNGMLVKNVSEKYTTGNASVIGTAVSFEYDNRHRMGKYTRTVTYSDHSVTTSVCTYSGNGSSVTRPGYGENDQSGLILTVKDYVRLCVLQYLLPVE